MDIQHHTNTGNSPTQDDLTLCKEDITFDKMKFQFNFLSTGLTLQEG